MRTFATSAMPNPADATRRAYGACLFQPEAYRAAYLSSSVWYRRPFIHYLTIGARRGQRPNPFFDPAYYRAQLAAAGVRRSFPLLNFYLRHGADRPESPSKEFDHSWYAAVNHDCLGGNHPLEHYLTRGLAEGRDPAPHIDLQRWMASHGATSATAPALMLRQIAATGRLEGEGVDYGFVSLEARQTIFRDNIDWRPLRRAAAPQRPNLVFVQTAPDAAYRFATPERGFDLMLNYYEDPGAEPHAACEYAIFQRGSKVTAIEAILRRDPTLLRSYERVIFLDDDIDLGAGDLDRFFDVMQSHDLVLAQPLLTPDSDCSWPIFRDSAHAGRVVPVDGVEVMMPAFSRAALDRLAWTFSEGISGFGIDLLWGQTWPEAQQAGRIAIIGEVSARHLRPRDQEAGLFYRFLARHGIDPQRELFRIMQRNGLKLGFDRMPVLPRSLTPVTCITAAASS
ncbi:hypothetical protein [Acidisphaera sp. S103]|uniref:hypothetical protein n=1 Tax=Acidisphaera sp. S103 TaxID=1747223 RepID=UPI00131DB88D|nr:hypothetical protein [Acidisphaera sp. S103]